MTLTKVYKTLDKYIEKYGADCVIFVPIDIYDIDEKGNRTYKQLPEITLGVLRENVKDSNWEFKGSRVTYTLRDLFKMLEKGVRPSKVDVFIPESYDNYRAFWDNPEHKKERQKLAHAFNAFMQPYYNVYDFRLHR